MLPIWHTIATIIPSGESEFKVHIYVSSSEIGNVKTGDRVRYGYLDSDRTVISNAFQYTEDHTVKGEFEIKGNELRFLTDSGEYLKGWQDILGERYHFGNTGYAEPQGWYQDTDGSWYCFDEYHRMKR